MSYTSSISHVKCVWFDESVLWEIEDKQFQDIAIKAKKCRSNILDETLLCNYWESNSFCVRVVDNFRKRKKSPGDKRYDMVYFWNVEEKSFDL